MVYLNQAGTSWPKPAAVHEAVARTLSLSPVAWTDTFHAAHDAVAAHFAIAEPERLLFTPGCTSALAVAIADHAWQPGDRIVVSHLEHHAVHRPATLLEARGVEVVVIPRAADGPLDLAALEKTLAGGRVRLVAMTAACNVTGELLPLDAIIRLAHEHAALCLIDGAQVCGWMDLDLPALGADIFTFAGHKGLHAPWGIGGLYAAPHVEMTTPAAACAVPAEGAVAPCAPMPGYCDVGSVDLVALAGLHAALGWLEAPAQADRLARARGQIERMTKTLEACAGVTLLGVRDPELRLPTVAFTVEGRGSGEVAASLAEGGLVVRGGLQCAPLAHEALGTAPDGAVRLSAGPLLPDEDVERGCALLASLTPAN